AWNTTVTCTSGRRSTKRSSESPVPHTRRCQVSNRFHDFTRVAVAVLAGFSLAPLPVGGQARPPGTKTWAAPRTPWGDPDLQGMWRREGVSQFSLDKGPFPAVGVGGKAYPAEFSQDGQQPAPLHPEALKRTRPSGVLDPPAGRLPWHPWAAARKQEKIGRAHV